MGNMRMIADFRMQIFWKWMLGWKKKIAEALSEHSEYPFKNMWFFKKNQQQKNAKNQTKKPNPADFEHTIWLLTLGPLRVHKEK